MDIDGIIFDLDGTLWDSSAAVWNLWNQVIEDEFGKEKRVTKEAFTACIGRPMDEFIPRLLPDVSVEDGQKLLKTCCKKEQSYLREHGAILYPRVREVLEVLSSKVPLYIVSNCQSGYIDCFLHAHKLGAYFSDTECFGNTGVSKGESNKLLIARNHLQYPVYVGDTKGDFESAKYVKIPFVYARYGFGQVDEFDYVIDTFEDLLTLPWILQSK